MNDIDPARLERACAHLGDTVIDPAMWPEILEQISAAVGALHPFDSTLAFV